MDYFAHYKRLMLKARSRGKLQGYKERHHWVPSCMGGSDAKSNLVDLTPEEHYVAHLLLVKMFPSNGKLIYAAWMMCNCSSEQVQRSNKAYGWLRRKTAEVASNQMTGRYVSKEEAQANARRLNWPGRNYKHTEEDKKKISLGLKRKRDSGWVQSAESRKRAAETLRGRPLSKEHRKSISRTLTGKPGHKHTAETKALIKQIWDLRRKKWGPSGRPPKPSALTL